MAPTPPLPPSTIRDEINKVEQVPVTNADGSITYITRALKLTEQEQAEQDELDNIMQEALDEIQRLSSSDYADDKDTLKILDAWEAERSKTLESDYSNRNDSEERALARRGISDSTAAQNVKRLHSLDKQDAYDSLSNERDLLGQNVRSDQIGMQQNLYNLAASQVDSTAVKQQQSVLQGRSIMSAQEQARQASLNDYYNSQITSGLQSSLFGQAVSAASSLGSVGSRLGLGLFGL